MTKRTIAIIGSTGLVGQGIVTRALAAGHRVVAVSRSAATLAPLADRHGSSGDFISANGSLSDDASAAALAAQLAEHKVDAVVITINDAFEPKKVKDLTGAELMRGFQHNVALHVAAARYLLPVLPDNGIFLGLGGGMADLIFPGQVAMSMNQSAQRTLYRYLAKENEKRPIAIRELMIFSMVTPGDTVIADEPYRISAEEVGSHVCAILADPDAFNGPILSLKSKKQVGLPENPSSRAPEPA